MGSNTNLRSRPHPSFAFKAYNSHHWSCWWGLEWILWESFWEETTLITTTNLWRFFWNTYVKCKIISLKRSFEIKHFRTKPSLCSRPNETPQPASKGFNKRSWLESFNSRQKTSNHKHPKNSWQQNRKYDIGNIKRV